jgi:hypothetical protein
MMNGSTNSLIWSFTVYDRERRAGGTHAAARSSAKFLILSAVLGRPDQPPLLYAFRIMAGIGFALFFLMAWTGLAALTGRLRTATIIGQRRLWARVATIPLGYIASRSGIWVGQALFPVLVAIPIYDQNVSSKYPPAKPGALRVEPLKAAIGVAGAPPICGPPEGGSWVPRLVCCVLQLRIRFVSYTGEVPRARSSVDGALLVHLATRARRFVDGRLWRDCRKCQTFAASPAEPGDLLC